MTTAEMLERWSVLCEKEPGLRPSEIACWNDEWDDDESLDYEEWYTVFLERHTLAGIGWLLRWHDSVIHSAPNCVHVNGHVADTLAEAVLLASERAVGK